jgi:alpha(1,3/1,4) fucosyltransferase
MRYVAIVPSSDYYLNDKMFNSEYNRDDRILHYISLKDACKENNITIHTIDQFQDCSLIDVVFFERIDYELIALFVNKYTRALRIAIPWEPEVVAKRHTKASLLRLAKYFDYIFTWNDDLIDDKKFLKMNYPSSLAIMDIDASPDSFKERFLLTQVSSNLKSDSINELYSTRKTLNHELPKVTNGNYTYYGKGWNIKDLNYGGEPGNKFEVISQYKFTLSFENSKNLNGYITEKIFDCFRAKTVPVYYGSNNVLKYIPPSTFIDFRNYESLESLEFYLSNIGFNEWKSYIDSAHSFLHSEESKQFSIDTFVDKYLNAINSNYNRDESIRHFQFFLFLLSCYDIFFNNIRNIKRRLSAFLR